MNNKEAKDIKCWTSSRQRCCLRRKLHQKISSSSDQSEVAVEMIKWLLEKHNSLTKLLGDELDSDLFVKQACYEVLAMAAHLCESYKVTDTKLINIIISDMFTSPSHIGAWFQFLNPFGNVNSTITTDSLYPFKPIWRNYNGLREKTWITRRHLEALEYYLTMANRQLFLIRNDFAAKDGGNSYQFLTTQSHSDERNPSVVLVNQSAADADNTNCINGHYLTLRPNLQAAFPGKTNPIAASRSSNPAYNTIGEVFLDDSSESSDHSINRNDVLSPLQISSGDDSEVSSITADLVPTIQRVSLIGCARFRAVSEDFSDSSLESPRASIVNTKRRHSSTNTDPDSIGVLATSLDLSHQSGTCDERTSEALVESKNMCEKMRTVAVQTCTYTAVTLVNFPLESSVMGTMTPLTLACLQGAPEATLLLLRHSASPMHTFSQTHCCMHDINQPIYAVVNQLNLFANDILNAFKNYKNATASQQLDKKDDVDIKVSNYAASPIFRDGSQAGYHHSVMFNRGNDWLICLSYMSWVMKSWPPMMTEEQTQVHECPAPGPRLPIQFAEFLPEMCSGRAPPGLQHLCRCTIRDKLGQLRKLPEGITRLPLPASVWDYIDLKE